MSPLHTGLLIALLAALPAAALACSGSNEGSSTLGTQPTATQDAAPPGCSPGFTDCGGTCADLKKDLAHCGACGAACKATELCTAGKCATWCPAGLTECGGACVPTSSDPLHCGGCAKPCKSGEVCSAGVCSASCPAGMTACSGACVNPKNDAAHCGACDNACNAGELCAQGACVGSCPAGFTACNGACTNLNHDALNCAQCGKSCDPGQLCVAGVCSMVCPPGTEKCNGVCASTHYDPTNCGACDVACKAGEVCASGVCTVHCPAGFTNCSGACVNLANDPAHCGACDSACAAGQSCSAGTCALACPAGFSVCNSQCVNLQTDLLHCGACAAPCAPGQVCSAGACTAWCQAGFLACGGACADPQLDPANCGACFNACSAGQSCVAGACKLACPTGLTACNGACTSLQTDLANCGACGTACTSGQLCLGGACVDWCPPGQTACSGACVDTQSSAAHCGACGNSCPSGQLCVAGTCAASCAANLIGGPIPDPWDITWDGLERPQLAYADAKAKCESLGARLPTATELHRVSATQSGAVGQSYATAQLWSLVPASPTTQLAVRLSDGVAAAVDSAPATLRPYRCVCAPPTPAAFTDSACNAAPGQTCFPLTTEGKRYNTDSLDRPALPKSSAVWECAWYHAHLAEYVTAMEAIKSGWPNGTNAWLHTFDDARYNYDTLVRWSGTGSTAWDPNGNTTPSVMTDFRPFRCAGVNYEAGTHPNAVVDEFVGTTSGYKGEKFNGPLMSWINSHENCYGRGGHLARSGELAELIQQGLPGGTNEWLWTSDQLGWNNTNFLAAIVRWTGTAPRFAYAHPTDISWAYKTDALHTHRCIYYPLDQQYAGPAEADCQGGCFKLTMAGQTPAVMWFDSTDRAAGTLSTAIDTCLSKGGHLASERDYAEAIRHGLPAGSNTWNLTWDYGWGEYGHYIMVVKWTGVSSTFVDQYSADMTWTALNASYPFRCTWRNELR